MQSSRVATSVSFVSLVSFVLIVALAAVAASAEDASGQPAAQPSSPAGAPAPAARPAKPAADRPAKRTDAEKAAARAKAEARRQQRLDEANKRQTDAYLAQVASLDLSAEQKSEVEGLAARQSEWTKANSARISELNEKIIAARYEGDVQAVKTLTADMQKLVRTRPDLDDILTKEQREKLNAQAEASVKAARAKAGVEGPGKTPVAKPHAGEGGGMAEVHARLKAARQAGDAEAVKKIEAEIQLLKEAVRKERIKQAAANKKSGVGK